MRLFEPVSWRAIPPNAITASAMACGIVSVFLSLSGTALAGLAGTHLQQAAWFVLLATLLDKADGSVARALKGSSEFGVQFDSFADSIAFGVAPAALIFGAAPVLAPRAWGPEAAVLGLPAGGLLGFICLAYAIFTAIRLARFNVTTGNLGPSLFLGLPSTLSGGLVCSAFLAVDELGAGSPGIYQLFPWLLACNAALMVSNLPLPKAHLTAHKFGRVLQIGAAVAVYGCVLARAGYVFVLLLLLGYLGVGFGWLGPRLWRQRLAQ